MPWKENNNGDGPWGEPGENPSNDSKKRIKIQILII